MIIVNFQIQFDCKNASVGNIPLDNVSKMSNPTFSDGTPEGSSDLREEKFVPERRETWKGCGVGGHAIIFKRTLWDRNKGARLKYKFSRIILQTQAKKWKQA